MCVDVSCLLMSSTSVMSTLRCMRGRVFMSITTLCHVTSSFYTDAFTILCLISHGTTHHLYTLTYSQNSPKVFTINDYVYNRLLLVFVYMLQFHLSSEDVVTHRDISGSTLTLRQCAFDLCCFHCMTSSFLFGFNCRTFFINFR